MLGIQTFFHADMSAAEYASNYFDHLQELLAGLDRDAIGEAVSTLERCCEAGGTIYFIGNGGSAGTASHYANDFLVGTLADDRKPFRAVSLMDNNAVVSCIANDFGFEEVFSRQLDPVLAAEDVVFALSVSGNSSNIIKAVELAQSRNATVIGVTGFSGGALRAASDISLHIDAPDREYGPVEDVFQIVDHVIVSYLQMTRRGCL